MKIYCIKRFISIFFAVFLSLLMSSNVNASDNVNSATLPIVVGSFIQNYPHDRPMILFGNEKSTTWSFVKTISGLTDNLYQATLFAISCDGGNCIAAGRYSPIYGSSFPLLLISNDHGQSWSFTENVSGIPSNYENIYVNTVSCSYGICLSGGMASHDDYKKSEHIFFPLLLLSKDNGKSWSRENGGLFTNLINKEGSIYDIIHSENNLLVAGYYLVPRFPWGSYQRHFLMLSKDNGLSWSFLTKNSGLPSAISDGGFDTIYCSNHICFAGGWGGSNEDGLPLILKSNDNGQSWSIVKNIYGLTRSLNNDNPNLNKFSCTGSTCVTVGNWVISESPSGVPLLLVSNNNGESWSAVKTVTGLPPNLKYPSLNTVYCTEGTCLAGGGFDKGSNPINLPLFLISKDDGHTWSLIKNISNLPLRFKDANINAIQCVDKACSAVGSWWEQTDRRFPLLLISQDRGQNWLYVDNITDFPVEINSGELVSEDCLSREL